MKIVVTGDSDIRLYRHYPRLLDNGELDRTLYYLQWMQTLDNETSHWLCARVSRISYVPRPGAWRVRTYNRVHVLGAARTAIFDDKQDADICAVRCAGYLYRLIAETARWSIPGERWATHVCGTVAGRSGALEMFYAN